MISWEGLIRESKIYDTGYLLPGIIDIDMVLLFRSKLAKDGPPVMEGCTSLYDMFQQSVAKYGDNPCLGSRSGKNGEYEWLTYKQVDEKVANLGSAMASIGLGPHGRVGIYGANSAEWMMAMQACNRMNLYCVPLYDTLGENAIDYIVEHSGM